MTELKNSIEAISSRLDQAEENINDLKTYHFKLSSQRSTHKKEFLKIRRSNIHFSLRN